jgi:GTPase SAR1 family protein
VTLPERKIVVLGNSGVGKSSIIRQFIQGNDFKDSSVSKTIGAERFIKDAQLIYLDSKQTKS